MSSRKVEDGYKDSYKGFLGFLCRFCSFRLLLQISLFHKGFAGLSLLGCPADRSVRASAQTRMKMLLSALIESEAADELFETLWTLVEENTGTAGVVHEPSQAQGYATTDARPLPCVPGILTTEFLQLMWVWKKEDDPKRARAMILRSDRHFAFLRISPWVNLLKLGYGEIFAASQAICRLVPSPPQEIDLVRVAKLYHRAWPGSTTTEATTFKQFHVLTGYLTCPSEQQVLCGRIIYRGQLLFMFATFRILYLWCLGLSHDVLVVPKKHTSECDIFKPSRVQDTSFFPNS